jgi:mRNA interferase RelE/StbE
VAYRVRIKESALKAIRKLDRGTRGRIWAAIEGLAEHPRPTGRVKLAGEDNLWRIRMGDYRIVYQVRDAELVVIVVRVGHRRDVYRER